MPVHPQIAAFLATLPPSDDTPPDLAAWRAMGEAHLPPIEDRLPLAVVEDRVASTDAGEVPVRVYRAAAADTVAADVGADAVVDVGTGAGTADAEGLVVYLHGGAFFSGSLETHDAIARSLAAALGGGWAVLSVGYRLAPEAAFPAGLDDSYAVLRWAVDHAAELGWSGERLAVAGDSSGGTFVAALTARAHDEGFDRVTHQVLLYPSVDLDFDVSRYDSLRENAVGGGLETVALKPHNSYYLASGADPADPRVSPIKREDLAGLPAALVITAEYDPLRDEGEAYARRLEQAGVPVTLHRYAGATHGFVQHFGQLPEFAVVFEEIAEFLRGE
ncbi:MAG: alpha/beta hydrolase [Leucobacter sp.]